MKKLPFFLSLFLIGSINYIFSDDANHLIFSKVCIAPKNAQMVQIYNPTPDAINLNESGVGSYYLTDGTNSSAGKYYYNIVTGSNYWSESYSDFFVQFPEDIIIESGAHLTISMHDDIIYNQYYSLNPDLSLYEMADYENYYNLANDDTGEAAMSILPTAESLILFYWDGTSSTVKDVDYFLWGSNTFSIDKTDVPGYLADTPINNQIYLDESDEHHSYIRISNEEEENINGNGITGHDETSENLALTWEIIQTPGIYLGCSDSEATNYDAEVNIDDGTCFYHNNTIMDIVTHDTYIPDSGLLDCDNGGGYQASIAARIKSYLDLTVYNGPEIIVLEDENGFRIEAIAGDYPDLWDVQSSSIGHMIEPYSPYEYLVGVIGRVCEYDGQFQFVITSDDDITELEVYYTHGIFIEEDEPIISAEIITAPYVIIPTLGERLDFQYSFPSNSRVVIRILDLNGRFITSLVDKYYENGGTVERFEDESDWNGRNHLGQIVSPGTYLIHMEASNFQSGKTTTDVAPIVVGVHH